MLAAFVIATCIGADDPLAVQVRKSLAAREEAFKRATWSYYPRPVYYARAGKVNFYDETIAVYTEELNGRRLQIQSPKVEWVELTKPSGQRIELARMKPKAVRENLSFWTVEMQGLAVDGRYGALSSFLANALAERLGDGGIRFTVSETMRQRQTHRLEFDFEHKAPFRLQEFRCFIHDHPHFPILGEQPHHSFRNLVFDEIGGHWYAKSAVVNRIDADGKPKYPAATVQILNFQPSSPSIDLAKLEAGLGGKNAKVVDEFRSNDRK